MVLQMTKFLLLYLFLNGRNFGYANKTKTLNEPNNEDDVLNSEFDDDEKLRWKHYSRQDIFGDENWRRSESADKQYWLELEPVLERVRINQ